MVTSTAKLPPATGRSSRQSACKPPKQGRTGRALARAICSFRKGRIADRSHEAQKYRASGLNLVIAGIYWNLIYISDAVEHLCVGGTPAPNELLRHTSPVGWEHIAFSGDFLWEKAARFPIERRPLNLAED